MVEARTQMLIEDVEFLRGIERQHMNDLGYFCCDFTEDGCNCEAMEADHVKMHQLAMHEFIQGIQPGTNPEACPTCTPTRKLTKLYPTR